MPEHDMESKEGDIHGDKISFERGAVSAFTVTSGYDRLK